MSAITTSMNVSPGRCIGFITLGVSLHDILTRLKAHPQIYPSIDLSYSSTEPISMPVIVTLPQNGLRLRFDGPDQRLRLIEVIDFTRTKLVYREDEIFKAAEPGAFDAPYGPNFRHIYKLFGPPQPGEYVPPPDDAELKGTYVLSYPGIAFSFPLLNSAWSQGGTDSAKATALLMSSAASPAVSMALFSGHSWPDSRGALFTAEPPNPRSLALSQKGKEVRPAEIEIARIHGEGRVELVRKLADSFWITLSETTPQDLITELGPPDAIYKKVDWRLDIHKEEAVGVRSNSVSPARGEDSSETGYSSSSHTEETDESDVDNERIVSENQKELESAEVFYNYFSHGFDILISKPTSTSPPSPTAPKRNKQEAPRTAAPPANHLTATKVIFHGNIPGSYTFNRHRRSRWTLEHVPSQHYTEALTSEMKFKDVRGRLEEVFKDSYAPEDPVNVFREVGDSPSSSIELVGGPMEGMNVGSMEGTVAGLGNATDKVMGNTQIFPFPGMLFEVLKNDACRRRRGGDLPILGRPSTLAKSWSGTLHLPRSAFPARPQRQQQAPLLRAVTNDLYKYNISRPECETTGTFVLHDGPPYANGPLHIGHALNKILKDVVNRFWLSQGKKVKYVPGWDCHGLPIEIKALQSQSESGEQMEPVAVRRSARKLAEMTVEKQMEGFRNWAVMGDWESPYKTMDRDFVLRQLEVFKAMLEKGLIYRQYKPVYWSPSSGTALAEAELEYEDDHRSTAAFVAFPLMERAPALRRTPLWSNVYAVIWTTTPWTLPANMAIALNSGLFYQVIEVTHSSGRVQKLLVEESRVKHLIEHLDDVQTVTVLIYSISGQIILGTKYHNPLVPGSIQEIVHADFVTSSSGTGLVHLAPGHGMEDYDVCSKIGISAYAPVDGNGKFDGSALPYNLASLSAKTVQGEGVIAVLNLLNDFGKLSQENFLLAFHEFRHKYPIDWRTKQPVIIRATEQWFADVDGIKESALKAIEEVKFIPPTGRARLESFTKSRAQWCISRQRSWGVPIPALYRIYEDRQEAVMDSEIVSHIMNVMRERGTDAWWTDAESDSAWIPDFLVGKYARGKDTMDVWFDSGTTWTLLDKSDLPADVYLEGTDQHHQQEPGRPTTISAQAPFKTLITHGFTLDQDGRKMSKSLGNTISPDEIINGSLLPPLQLKKNKNKARPDKGLETPSYDAMGIDALRLWVASSDYTRDVVIGTQVLQSVNSSLRKLRITFKWLLGALADYDPDACLPGPPLDDTLADQIAFRHLQDASHSIHQSYQNYEFFKAMQRLDNYINNDLSAFYFEAIKDRIYAGISADRRIAQETLHAIFRELLFILGPVTPTMVEEIWSHIPPKLKSSHPLQTRWIPLSPNGASKELSRKMAELAPAREAFLVVAEQARRSGKIGSALECDVEIVLPASYPQEIHEHPALFTSDNMADLAAIFVVSDVRICEEKSEEQLLHLGQKEWSFEAPFTIPPEAGSGSERAKQGKIVVRKAMRFKCDRCWRYVAEQEEQLCERCEEAVWEVQSSDASRHGS
ncbi:isoleucyl-tRNA synthetase [Rhizodiscina lignyota]|uniref:Isoleucine--tRNA ligase, mitochondrial n=1 Tax=Rhizodiscina lignyota TaxID=1504668 RepID=A0A9P4MCE8_9PEZI|nr:isoleucyl-tRNA synthetase [Rhizodiscina lignyota]